MKRVLFMTSTIAPAANVFLLAHNSPAKRLLDYSRALSFYVRLLKRNIVDKLVYVDNSGHDLTDLRMIAQNAGVTERCEFVSFRSEPQANVSRYFLEINLIKEAMVRSEFLAGADVDIWKVTGRYIILNAAAIIARAPVYADFYVNCRNHPHRTLDFYFVCFNRATLERLLTFELEEFRTIRSGEDILRERLDRISAAGLVIIPRFSETPRIVGTRGFDGACYGGGKDSAKYAIRCCLNKILPQVWI
jgi:hypothetical protein